MNKFLNFNTILFSYVLITVLAISCGGSSGGGDGSDGNDGSSSSDGTSGNDGTSSGDGTSGNDGTSSGDGSDVSGGVPQPEPKDDCLLADRPDKDSLVAVLCQGDIFIGLITKTTPAGQEAQQLDLLIPSTESEAIVPPRIWDLSKGAKIQISYDKDYTLTVDEPADGASPLGALSDAADHTAEFPLQNLTIASLLNDTKEALRSGGITFSSASGSAIKVAIAPKLAVKSQADFRSMGLDFSIADLLQTLYKRPFVLVNDLNLVAPGGEGSKFEDAIIPDVGTSLEFDGAGYTISLNSAIDSAWIAAIIARIGSPVTLKNFILDINKPILGRFKVGALVGSSTWNHVSKLHDIKININRNISAYQGKPSSLYIGGVAGDGCFDINNVVVKTAKDVAIQADAKPYTSNGGLVGLLRCENDNVNINNNVVDVTLGFFDDNYSGDFSGDVRFGGLSSYMKKSVPGVNNNLVKLAISRGNLPADFTFLKVAGLSPDIGGIDQVTNNLVYADFSNLGKVQEASGLLLVVGNDATINNKTANNMVFIADGFDGSSVTTSFGSAFYRCSSALNITDNFFSSPVTDYGTNEKLASFLYFVHSNINFNNLILDNKDAAVMFKEWATYLNNARDRVSGAKLFTLAEAKTTPIGTLFSAGNTSWEEGSQGYPQLKAPADFSEAKKADWDRVNGLIQEGLADRDNK